MRYSGPYIVIYELKVQTLQSGPFNVEPELTILLSGSVWLVPGSCIAAASIYGALPQVLVSRTVLLAQSEILLSFVSVNECVTGVLISP